MSQVKTKSSVKNFLTSMTGNIIAIIIALAAQKIFIDTMGNEYLGLNGLFTNIISMLAIVELGIGSAIVYNLYKPLASNDQEAIKSLMLYYRKAYRIIALITFLLGLLIAPFIHLFVRDVDIVADIYIIYLLFLLDASASYLLSYRRSILYADQKNYIISIMHIVYLLLLNAFQIFILITTKNYCLYLVVKVIIRVLENLAISLVVSRQYPYLSSNAKPLARAVQKDITKKVKALFMHKIGTFLVLGTDNLIISRYLGVATVGLYSNYYIIINALNTIFGQAIIALTPSVGHLLIEGNPEKSFEVFKKIRFATFWISTFSAVGLLVISAPFIELWLGEQYVLGLATVSALVFNYFQKMMRNSYITFKEAAGIYHEDRFIPIIESAINVVASITLVKIIGLPGVFIGTIISGLALWCYSYPRFVYKKLFHRSYLDYAKETIGYILTFVLIAVTSYCCLALLPTTEPIINQLLTASAITILLPNLFIIILFHRTENFKYFLQLVRKASSFLLRLPTK